MRETVFAYFRSFNLTRIVPAINHTAIIKVDYFESRFAVRKKKKKKEGERKEILMEKVLCQSGTGI
jgi:hypothetical protein